jgi:ADP-ribosyl-[dinitrogen reductase] hydrolase
MSGEAASQVLLDRFQGCLVGLAVGDALGAPVEFATHYEIQKRYGILQEMVGGGWLHLEPGQWTDDTAEALALAESYVSRRGFDGRDFIFRLLAWFQSNPPDVGNHTRHVLELIREFPTEWANAGKRVWHESGGTAAGNGSLMRCAPTAMFRYNNLEALIRESILASQATHFDPRCCEACVILNFLIAQCLHGRFSPELEEQARLFHHSLREMIVYHHHVGNYDTRQLKQAAVASLEIPYLEDRHAIERALAQLPRLKRDDLRSSGYVVDIFQTALYLLFHSSSFYEGLVWAVNLGGDADTLGAVTGALLGARFGYSQIPAHWSEVTFKSQRIRDLAELMFQLAPPPEEEKPTEKKP